MFFCCASRGSNSATAAAAPASARARLLGRAFQHGHILIDSLWQDDANTRALPRRGIDDDLAIHLVCESLHHGKAKPRPGPTPRIAALLEGLRGKAAREGEGVRLLGLADYVYREVMRLSDSRQEPFYSLLETSNFLLAQP